MKQHDPDIHLWAGNLLFNIEAYADAIKTYSNVSGIANKPDILLLRAKCYIVFKELNCALEDMDRIIELKTDIAKNITFDKYCLSSLKTASSAASATDTAVQRSVFVSALAEIKKTKNLSKSIQGGCFHRSDYIFYKGVYRFFLGDYQKALIHFKDSFALKSEEAEKEQAKNLEEELEKHQDDSED